MEVPPGRLERSLSGGKDALAALLAEAAERRLNGLLATSRTREDVPARGVLVFHKGNGSLAHHPWRGGGAGARRGPPPRAGLGAGARAPSGSSGAVRWGLRGVGEGHAALLRALQDQRESGTPASAAERKLAEVEVEKARAGIRALAAETEAKRSRLEGGRRALEAEQEAMGTRSRDLAAAQAQLAGGQKQPRGGDEG